MSSVRIFALPRDRNPYQELLYGPMRSGGAVIRYGGELTGSRTVNLLLLPAELLLCRLCGYTIFHLHWVFAFWFTGSQRYAMLLRLSRLWFMLVLALARRFSFKVVWTAHNALPHTPVFDDDVKARRALIRASDLVLAHSESALDELAQFGVPLRHGRVVPHGPILAPGVAELSPLSARQPRQILFFGRIAAYKGVEDLLQAVRDLGRPLDLVVAGECPDGELHGRLVAAAGDSDRVTLRLEHVADEAIAPLFAAADAVVFPFRKVTTSGSIHLALASGRCVVVPDLPAFAELPAGAVLKYPPGIAGLRTALRRVAAMDPDALGRIGAAGRAATGSLDWRQIAAQTFAAISEISAPARTCTARPGSRRPLPAEVAPDRSSR
jgi:glycosyltransferase involved in cell wall biosynthesis